MNGKICCILCVVILLIAGCASMESSGEYASAETAAYDDFRAMSAPEPPMAAAKQSMAGSLADFEMAEVEETIQASGIPERPTERIRVYSGYGRLIVEDMEETKESLSRLAENNNGYVEGVWANIIILRVPKDLFEDLFEQALSFGEVAYRKTETVDVTEYYTDTAVRLSIAERTRDRLYKLLERTEDVEERLRILQEIRRLTEEIERIRNTLRSLEKQVAFSRIQIELESRLSEEAVGREGIPFHWIASLNPLYPSQRELKNTPDVSLDDSFAVFSEEHIFRAENPAGVRFRISRTFNNPIGDTAFWQEALVYHLSPFYAEAERVSFSDGDMLGVLFTSKDTNPFFFLVVQKTLGRYIYVFETFFPGAKEFEDSREAVFSALEGTVIP